MVAFAPSTAASGGPSRGSVWVPGASRERAFRGIYGRYTVAGHWRARLQRRIGEEVQYIVDAFSAKGINVGVETEGTGVGYLYAEGEVLVLEQHVVQVREILDRREPDQQPEEGEPRSEEPQRVLRGLVLQRFSGKSVPEVLEQIDRELGEGAATPNHILTVSGEASPCAATDPIEAYDGTNPSPT